MLYQIVNLKKKSYHLNMFSKKIKQNVIRVKTEILSNEYVMYAPTLYTIMLLFTIQYTHLKNGSF